VTNGAVNGSRNFKSRSMHKQARAFVESLKRDKPEHFKDKIVLEIGSLNINGSCRDMFENCGYTGVDLTEGEGVDIVGHAADLILLGSDTTYSTEALEHDERWQETFKNMYSATRSNGLVFFTCATTGRKEHGTHDHSPESSPGTNDYYRNLTERDFRESFALDAMFSDYEFSTNEVSHDLYFWGIVL